MLTNRPRSFLKPQKFEIGLIGCHKLVVSILRASFKKLPRKIITYRVQKRFLRDLDSRLLQGELYRNCDEPYKKLTEIFNDILNHHAPLKQKQVRGNHDPFMTKDLSKAIINKSKAKNKYLNWPSRENFISYKRTKNKCNFLTKKAKTDFFKEAKKDGIMTSKALWRSVKLFLTNNGCAFNDYIGTENEGNLICNEQELGGLFNEYCINVVEKSSSKRSSLPEVFCKKGVLRNFAKFTGKHLCQSFIFNKVTGLGSATLLKERFWHRCFPINFAKFLRTSFYIEQLWRLLL